MTFLSDLPSIADYMRELQECERAEQVLHERQYLVQLHRHPDCADPNHPGCADCEEDE